MGLLDKILGNDEPAKKADFSDVQSGSSSTAPAPAQTTSAGASTYTVVSGDSLSKIAKHHYGDANKWHAIYEANRDKIKNPDLIHPGQVLTIPDIS
jgi:nucleoid-associated protein YgaU